MHEKMIWNVRMPRSTPGVECAKEDYALTKAWLIFKLLRLFRGEKLFLPLEPNFPFGFPRKSQFRQA